MNQIERLLALAPWEQISEEDFFWVGGFYVSIRGNFATVRGAYFCPSQRIAEGLLKIGRGTPPQGTFLLSFPPDSDAPNKVAPVRKAAAPPPVKSAPLHFSARAASAPVGPLPEVTVTDGRGGSRMASQDESKRVLAALDRCLNVFEDRTDSGVKFPVNMTLEEW